MFSLFPVYFFLNNSKVKVLKLASLGKTSSSGTVSHVKNKLDTVRTSLVVQWLGLHAPNVGDPGLIPGQETRVYVPQLKILHATVKFEDSACCN